MITLELNEEAFEEVRSKCAELGLTEDFSDEPFAVGGITFKRWEYVPTPEEIARNEAWLASPMGKAISDMLTRSNEKMGSMSLPMEDNVFMSGVQWGSKEIGTELRIRLPADYAGKDQS